MKFYELVICLLALVGCASVQQQLDPAKFYRHDLLLEVNGLKGQGTLVVPRSDRYQIEVESRSNMDLFTLTTCHREIATEKVGKETRYGFQPVSDLEDQGGCPVHIGGYDKGKGQHAWGFIDFETPEANLPATLRCNGAVIQSRGVSVCQSRAGLFESIEFETEVNVSPDSRCEIPIPKNRKQFVFSLPKGECVYAFMEIQGSKRIHRLSTLGYENILIRGD